MALPPRRRRAAERDAGHPPSGDREETRPGLILLILTGDARSGDLAAWRRGRSVLREVDKKIAMTYPGFQVRALPNADGAARSELRQAGRLSRRHLKRPAACVDFARGLGVARTMMKRDLATLERRGLRVMRPTVVFFTVDPPLADAITTEEYEQLARQASVTWVVPERSAGLMSPVFADNDARVLTDHRGVADEVVYLLSSSADAAGALIPDSDGDMRGMPGI
jgi:hypothetical protein